MELEGLYTNTNSWQYIQQFAESSQKYLLDSIYLIYILIGVTSLFVGIQIGKSDVLISKKQRQKIEQYKNLREQKEKSKEYLLKEQQKLSRFSIIFYFLIVIANISINYIEIQIVRFEIQIAISIGLILLTEGYKKYEKYRLSSIKHNLEQTAKETKQIILDIQKNLGDDILTLIKNQFSLQQGDYIKQKIAATEVQLQSQFEQKYKDQIEELKKKIRTLEDKEFQQKQELHNFKRNTQSHKTEPILKQNQNLNDDGISLLKKQIVHLQKEGQIQKDMISKVINFEWCQDCIAMKVHCIEAYFQQAKTIGDEYQQKLEQLEKDN
ncbi:unnamed protein product [Paramecium pentaurelia]|uniref:Transmembrane protein n=1 Tax=Paramecium pentaurelia TaxID=43138 RepID=A0A8S1TX21_9CILI|nr:unnamed protein product [Paramecium pentaurelia]